MKAIEVIIQSGKVTAELAGKGAITAFLTDNSEKAQLLGIIRAITELAQKLDLQGKWAIRG